MATSSISSLPVPSVHDDNMTLLRSLPQTSGHSCELFFDRGLKIITSKPIDCRSQMIPNQQSQWLVCVTLAHRRFSSPILFERDSLTEQSTLFKRSSFLPEMVGQNGFCLDVVSYCNKLALQIFKPNEAEIKTAVDAGASIEATTTPSDSEKPVYTINIYEPYLTQVRTGVKSVDARVNEPKYASLEPGKIVRFALTSDQSQFVDMRIKELKKYDSFHAMLTAHGVQTCLPQISTIEEAVKIYQNFPGYKEKESRYGVIAIILENK